MNGISSSLCGFNRLRSYLAVITPSSALDSLMSAPIDSPQLFLQLVLSEEQKEEKKALEAELAYAKDQLEKAVDPLKAKDLKEEVAEKETKLEDLLASFEVKTSPNHCILCGQCVVVIIITTVREASCCTN